MKEKIKDFTYSTKYNVTVCCNDSFNLFETETRWVCQVCGNELNKNGSGWLWKPQNHFYDRELIILLKPRSNRVHFFEPPYYEKRNWSNTE